MLAFFVTKKMWHARKGQLIQDGGGLFSWEHFSWAVSMSTNKDQLMRPANCHKVSSKSKLSLNDGIFFVRRIQKQNRKETLANLKIQEASTHPLNLKSGTSGFLSVQHVFRSGQCVCNMFLAKNALLPQFFFQVWTFVPLWEISKATSLAPWKLFLSLQNWPAKSDSKGWVGRSVGSS